MEVKNSVVPNESQLTGFSEPGAKTAGRPISETVAAEGEWLGGS